VLRAHGPLRGLEVRHRQLRLGTALVGRLAVARPSAAPSLVQTWVVVVFAALGGPGLLLLLLLLSLLDFAVRSTRLPGAL
jgi:hypothetical protein